MDIVIGSAPRINFAGRNSPEMEGSLVEARLLDVRGPRKRRGPPPEGDERRDFGPVEDPVTGRVLVLLVPEGHRIPRGVESGSYKIFLRFLHR
jgi:hypothetical protein